MVAVVAAVSVGMPHPLKRGDGGCPGSGGCLVSELAGQVLVTKLVRGGEQGHLLRSSTV
jgi:hypothetical protein